jgi:predicted XRE-type DNA-binding protein
MEVPAMAHNNEGGEDAKPLMQIRKSSPRVTAVMASKILTLGKMGMLQHDVAALFGINQGRVSEIINGKRFAETEPLSLDQLEFRFE